MEFVRSRWRLFLAIAAVTLVLLVVVGPHYGDLQQAADAKAFKDLLDDGTPSRFFAAGLIDLVFAAAYGLAALGLAKPPLVSRIGAYLVAGGAVADEAENVTLLVNVNRRNELTDGAVDTMRLFGTVKTAAIVLGLVGLFLGLASRRRTVIREWVRAVAPWYAAFVVVVILMVPLAWLRLHGRALLVMVIPLAALAYLGSRLNGVVRDDRRTATSPTTDHGAARTILATGQLAIGALLTWLGYRYQGKWADVAFFLGVALVVMSLGAYVSELRQSARFGPKRGLVLTLAALGLLGYAAMGARHDAMPLILIGILVGHIGTELLSADFLHWRPPFPNWVVGAVGVIVLLTGLSLLVSAGGDPGHVLAVVAALAVVVFFASADGDALIIVFLIAYALVWATSPVEARIDNALTPKAGEPYFVVFGDSYISGEGAETFIEGTNEKVHDAEADSTRENECRRATTAWPFVVANMAREDKSTKVPSRVLFLACSGAVSENIHTLDRVDEDGVKHGPAELALFRAKKAELRLGEPAFVLLSIGGNDAGFGDIGKTCVIPGNCAEVGEQFLRGDRKDEPQTVKGPPGPGKAESLVHVRDDLRSTYKRVEAEVAADVPIIVAPYPIPLTEAGRCRGVLLDEDERRFIRGFVPQLNGVIRDVATKRGLYVINPMQDGLRNTGAQLCGNASGSAGLNFLALNPTSGSLADSISPKNWVHNSLHPNADGHRALARVAYDWLSKELPLTAAPKHMPDKVAAIDAVLGGAAVTQCDRADRASCVVDGGVWAGEQVHDYVGRVLFPLAVVMFGLWLCLNPALRWGGSQDPPVTVASVVWPGLRNRWRDVSKAVTWLWRGS